MRRNQTRKRCVGSQKMQSALLPWRGERAALLTPSLIRMACGVNTRYLADLGSRAVHSRSAGVCRGWLCKLIDNLTGSDKTLARVHGAAIRAHRCQHDVVVQEDPIKFTLPFFGRAVVCFNKRQTHAGLSLSFNYTFWCVCVCVSGEAGPAELCNYSTSFLFPVTMVTVKKNSVIIRRIGLQKLFLSPLPHLSACYNQGTESPRSFHTAARVCSHFKGSEGG